ncbi:tannase and feruloyl esterase [Saccharata proteae CBS 121410]|uniref:Carboxylic ester hydrolase n=1 Tax=Saccharata proteae CBS 121410 TaxID=1314787 RepID=A0A6A5YEP9_9PEZI|nr:tannase and feruloyl esterase [Saccharata proteae CBS 121410]
MRSLHVAAAWGLSATASAATNTTFDQSCTALAGQVASLYPNASVWFSEVVTAGTNLSLPESDATCETPSQVVLEDICRLALEMPTSELGSKISLETWLPRNWTGRFASVGNGGLNGCVGYADLAYTSRLGFATVGTNNGHNGTRGNSFVNPEVLTDFAWRALHTGVVMGKEISKKFYGSDHKKSYYLGCSTGGRQGFKSVQEFPEDFDGVVAGAPGVAFNGLQSLCSRFYTILGAANGSQASWVPTSMWTTIHQSILDQCDGIDGAVDGIIEDPSLCQYRPEALLCANNATSNSSCLTGPQVEAVRSIFSPLYGTDGELIYPRMQPGSEIIAAQGLYNGKPFQYSIDWFQYAVYNDTTWDPLTAGLADYEAALKTIPQIQTWNGDLSAFKNRGGKLLHYHGLMDAVVSSENSPRYYDYVSSTMNLPSSELDEFYRFFRISGMSHCQDGDGAWAIGNLEYSNAGLDPEKNVLMAMVRWIEEGEAPETIIGTNLESGYTRAHCKYPARNVHTGGDPKDPSTWKCV